MVPSAPPLQLTAVCVVLNTVVDGVVILVVVQDVVLLASVIVNT
jgi:hypothetical protein